MALFLLCTPVIAQVPAANGDAGLTSIQAIHFEVPDTGNSLDNLMLGAVLTKATWMQDLRKFMEMGERSPLNLVVEGRSEHITRKAVKVALDSFKGRQLPYLNLTLVGDPKRGEGLRRQAEALGVRYQVRSSGQ